MQNYNCSYTGCENIESAFQHLAQNPVDLILCADFIENETATTFLHTLSQTPYRNIPVIVITTNDKIKVRTALFSAGVIDILPKGPEIANLLRIYIEKFSSQDSTISEMSNLSIAVVNDNKTVLSLIRQMFELNGLTHAEYFNKPQELLNSEKIYDIYLTDIIMPEIIGEQLILQIRKKTKNSIIIAISSIDNINVISHIL